MSVVQAPANQQLRVQFFDYLFGVNKGFLCIATADKNKGNFAQKFFEWPMQRHNVANYIEDALDKKDIWFCVNLLTMPERRKEFCLGSTFAWADLDYANPAQIEPIPTCVVESSPGRWQAYWRIEGKPIPADVAEDYSRKLAYSVGADKSGWDLTQLLRVPWTENQKYKPPVPVKLISINENTYDVTVFDKIPEVIAETSEAKIAADNPMPGLEKLPPADYVIYRYKAEGRLDDEFASLYTTTPDANADWSRILWRFIHKCFELGLQQEEVFVLAITAKCNKYTRDNRPVSYLWRDVIKAAKEHSHFEVLIGGKVEIVTMPHMVNFDEIEEDSFIADYKTWANAATDAPEQYHELGMFIALSAVVSAGLSLKVQWGEIVPNLWGLVLGESTLTRKTTAMRLVIDMLKDIDENLILATDGSAEGLLTGLSGRPKRVSIYWRDEVSGLFDSINRKDYLAGLPETLTHLYDVPPIYTRLLRKETITISEPYFIFFGGGIRDKVYSLINDEYILSGFLPRFLVVSGENDLSRLRRTGPPTEISTERKDNIIRSLSDICDRYNTSVTTTIAGQQINMPIKIEARLTDEAWTYYRTLEDTLTQAGVDTDMSMLALPTFSRLSYSLLKMSMLVAASRRLPDQSNRLQVETSDVKQAAFYIEKWGHYSIDLLLNAGRSTAEKAIDRALGIVKRKEGLTKAEFMQRQHLSAREAKDIIETMVQRGLIDIRQAGRGMRIYSV